MSDSPAVSLTLQDLPVLRRKTEAISSLLRQQITEHLVTLRPLFAIERILGKIMTGKQEVEGADKAFTILQQSYKSFTNRPYQLPSALDPHWLLLVGNKIEVEPWEYVHSIKGKPINMASPVCWVLMFRGNYSLQQINAVLAGKETPRSEYLRQFVVNALALQLVFSQNAGLAALFRDLRYQVQIIVPEQFGGVPLVTLTSCVKSFRPSDELIDMATSFSGVSAFIELIDLEDVAKPHDILREQIEATLQGS